MMTTEGTKVPRLVINKQSFEETLRSNLTPSALKLALLVLQKMSNTGQNLSDDTFLMKTLSMPYSSFRRATNEIINKGVASRDVFSRLYLINIPKDNRFTYKLLSWSDLANHLADNTDFKERSIDECWTWKGEKNDKGYGIVQVGKFTEEAHRLSYKIFNGKIGKKQDVHHAVCNNPSCVNPRHLETIRKDRHKKETS